ncbi:NAD-dependent epimerase/dehydratase family protein [Salinarimonas ramus]|uniref:CDP-paratose 2-epimerase n=1 Tax=Salinarimonas ramus TaxID=690164 RepID=A0A917QCU6_9HYPH|nr:NAD-dependent epimerase/dehydratase family protein [Salinarimonas ramus]GGK44921.1 CDP-paratose 2-epimerase [Salinarimonas ramus]
MSGAAQRDPRAGDLSADAPLVIVGGAGFIGANLAESVLTEGGRVTLVDTLARPGVERNLAWLVERHGERVRHVHADVRDGAALDAALVGARGVVHLAAQVAVTTSLVDPVEDFSINAAGTLSLLEAVRRTNPRLPVVFASTNKVYGDLAGSAMRETPDAYVPADAEIAAHGVSEAQPLDFHTPYGCSKGVADQYVLDYARSFGLRTAVMRMSCIYGPRQFGTEDQGWVAHFLIRALRGEEITIFGDGKQVRDVLHVSDAVGAYRTALARIDEIAGGVFNLGGGPANAVSLRAVIDAIEEISGPVRLDRAAWRQGDQLWFVADTRRLETTLGWRARTGWREGLADLARWLENQDFLRAGASPRPARATAERRLTA